MIVDEFGKPMGGIRTDFMSVSMLKYVMKLLEKFSQPRNLPWESTILNDKGIPFSKGKPGDTIKFRRYSPTAKTKKIRGGAS